MNCTNDWLNFHRFALFWVEICQTCSGRLVFIYSLFLFFIFGTREHYIVRCLLYIFLDIPRKHGLVRVDNFDYFH